MTKSTGVVPRNDTYSNAKLGDDVVIFCITCFSPFDVIRKKGHAPLYCDDCKLERHRDANRRMRSTKENPVLSPAKRESLYRRGLSPDDFWRIFVKQNEVCATCLTHKPKGKFGQWQVDIDDKGKIRGIFCSMCIRVVQNTQRDVELLQAHIQYVLDTK